MQGLFILVVLAIFAVVVVVQLVQGPQIDRAWAEAASGLGISFQKGSLFSSRRIRGRIKEYTAEIDTYTRNHGQNNRVTYTRFRIYYSAIGLGLNISAEGFWTGVTKFFGAQDIKVGDHDFDATALVKGRNAAQITEFLTSSRRLRIQRFLVTHSDAVIDDQSITWSQRGVIRDAHLLIREMEGMVKLADLLTTDGSDQALQSALDAQDQGHADDAIAILERHREELEQDQQPIDSDEQLLEGELQYLAGDQAQAKKRFESALSQHPDDPEIKQWSDAVDPEFDDQSHWEATEDVSPSSGLGVKSVTSELFGSGLTSYRITRAFENQFRGKEIHWSGTVRRVERYSYDLVFGSGPGCRCIVDLETGLENELNQQPVSAIVQFPQNAIDSLEKRVGSTITFDGTLEKVDGLLRKIYVSDAAL